MVVSSILEIYTTFSGWLFNNVSFEILSHFALAPFLVMIIAEIKKNFESSAYNNGLDTATKNIESSFYEMLLVVILFFIPFKSLDIQTITYDAPETNYITRNIPSSITAENDPSIFKDTFNKRTKSFVTDFSNPKVPVGLYLVMQLSKGFSYAMSKSIRNSNARYDLGAAQHALGLYTLEDPDLGGETKQFMRDCYVRARSKFLNYSSRASLGDILTEKSKSFLMANRSDINYAGSYVFQNTPGLYQKCTDPSVCGRTLKASQPIKGWPYIPKRDGVRSKEKNGLPGEPVCGEWWSSLRTRINSSSPDMIAVLNKAKGALGITSSPREEDLLAERVIRNSYQRQAKALVGTNDHGNSGGAVSKITNFLANEGIKVTGLVASFKQQGLKHAIMIVIDILLMILYILIPTILLFSGFRIKGVVICVGMIFVLVTSEIPIAIVEYINVSIYSAAYLDTAGLFNLSSNSRASSFVVISQLAYPVVTLFYFYLMGMIISSASRLASPAGSATTPVKPTNPKNLKG